MTTHAVEPPRKKKVWTYDDLAGLDPDKQYEIIDGELFVNASPITRHQKIALRLVEILLGLRRREGGELFFAPLDVVFDKKNVMQPDVLYVREGRADIVGDKNITGPPDLVIEILSEGTRRKDMTRKKPAYAKFGVPLYLVVDPEADCVNLFRLNGKSYAAPTIIEKPGVLEIKELGKLRIDTKALFAP